jgi:hypothetical protein
MKAIEERHIVKNNWNSSLKFCILDLWKYMKSQHILINWPLGPVVANKTLTVA